LRAAFRPANVTSVEHACYKCQAAVEEGVPFCPHCSAPQIRVIPPEAEQQEIPQAAVEAPSYPSIPSTSPWGPPRHISFTHTPIDWKQAWPGALLTGVGAALLSSLPVLVFGCFMWLFIAGAWTVSLYQRRVPTSPVRPGMGMRIGALAGVFAFIVSAIMSTALFSTEGEQLRKIMEDQIRDRMAAAPDPRNQEVLQQLMAKLNTPAGLATVFLWGLVLIGVIFVMFSALGGAMGASYSARRRRVP